ncbi:MAG: SAM-dependent methyltransferase [Byssovorax sp.]
MIIDITRPHVGRIYDYVLGGTQNYEADRRAAEAILETVPAYPRWARLNRSFLRHVGACWAAEGFKNVLDLGSGLPTQGHFNEQMPGAKILFADIDPLTVAQGQQLLAYSPDMAYANVDIRNPEALFEQAEAFFGPERRIAVGLIGIAYFLSDDEVRSMMERLHAFCAPGSAVALSFHHVPDGPDAELIRETLFASAKLARVGYYLRTPEHMAEVLAPWRTTITQPLQHWVGEETTPLVQPENPIHRMTFLGAFAER